MKIMTDHRQSRLHHTHQYVGNRIRRIRWQKLPQNSSITMGGILPENFATASCDEGGLGMMNEVAIWHLVAEEVSQEESVRRSGLGKGQGDAMDDDVYSLTKMPETDWKFVRSARLELEEDVYELQFVNEDHVVYGTSKGHLVLAKWIRGERTLRPVHVFDGIHRDNEGCLSFSILGNDIISLGSSGTLTRVDLNSLTTASTKQVGTIVANNNYNGIISSSKFGPMICVEHFSATEVVTGNAAGQLQLWDLRQRPEPRIQLPSNIPASGAVTAVRAHPSQRHVLAAGYQSGGLAFWDLRGASPIATSSAIDIHNGPIWELQFHPIYQSHLYSTCNDGMVLDWDASNVKLVGENMSITPWMLSSEQLHDQVKLTNLLPDNSVPVSTLDVVGDTILAGTDDDSIWMVKNLTMS